MQKWRIGSLNGLTCSRDSMKRVLVLGRGAAGKSTIAIKLGKITGLPVIELDKYFWPSNLTPLPVDQWKAVQRNLISAQRWILDGDLGPYDAPDVRLKAADTVIVLDFALSRCVW
jgi:adenylate kinase family enzyme